MRTTLRVAAVAAALFLLLPVAVVQAGAPKNVYISIETTLNAPSYGPFVATGLAVDAGVICPNGDTVDLWVMGTGGQSRNGGTNYLVLKQFTCWDQSGTFTLKFQVRVDPNRGSSYSWSVFSGTDAYTTLRGSGTGYGVNSTVTYVNDLLFGAVFRR